MVSSERVRVNIAALMNSTFLHVNLGYGLNEEAMALDIMETGSVQLICIVWRVCHWFSLADPSCL